MAFTDLLKQSRLIGQGSLDRLGQKREADKQRRHDTLTRFGDMIFKGQQLGQEQAFTATENQEQQAADYKLEKIRQEGATERTVLGEEGATARTEMSLDNAWDINKMQLVSAEAQKQLDRMLQIDLTTMEGQNAMTRLAKEYKLRSEELARTDGRYHAPIPGAPEGGFPLYNKDGTVLFTYTTMAQYDEFMMERAQQLMNDRAALAAGESGKTNEDYNNAYIIARNMTREWRASHPEATKEQVMAQFRADAERSAVTYDQVAYLEKMVADYEREEYQEGEGEEPPPSATDRAPGFRIFDPERPGRITLSNPALEQEIENTPEWAEYIREHGQLPPPGWEPGQKDVPSGPVPSGVEGRDVTAYQTLMSIMPTLTGTELAEAKTMITQLEQRQELIETDFDLWDFIQDFIARAAK